MEHHVILRVATRLMVPLILLFALYVQFHGDYGPGGGFQAGVIFGAALILYGIVFGADRLQLVFPPVLARVLSAGGVLLYAMVGVASLVLGGNYLDYGVLAQDPVHGQHLGIALIELGVGITVAAVMLVLFFAYTNSDASNSGAGTGH
ncbi:MAG: Na(+)/H(+) antiporter subunit B [Gammaproteobacteria bacterium]